MTWINKAKKDLRLIKANYSLQSYLQMNRKPDGTYYKKHRPYTIPNEGLKALEYLNILTYEITTKEIEEEIKAFLMPYRIYRTEYLKEIQRRMQK